jgi:hypothetical protein
LREIYWGTAATTPPILAKIILGYPNTCISGKDYWGFGPRVHWSSLVRAIMGHGPPKLDQFLMKVLDLLL